MTVVLVFVTLASLGLASGLLVYVLRMTREERDRSEARAAALAELLAGGVEPSHAPDVRSEPANLRTFEPSAHAETSAPWNPAILGPGMPEPGTQERGTLPRFLLIPAIGLVIVGLALSVAYVLNRPSAQATGTTATSAATPLDLVALRHERQGDGLVISGVVRNPHEGATMTGLAAVAFLFDRQGGYLTSGRAVIDFPQLKPGDESPFSITVRSASSVGRYRVSFRTDAGIVPHVDRRTDPGAAQAAAR